MSKRNGNGAQALKLDPHNARKHPDRNKAQIAASLKELGAGRSILVDATDTIIAGNGVYEQAQALGYKVKVIEADGKTLIAVKRPDLKGAKARRMALADNRATETSEWDVDVLADLAANDADALAGLFDERELRDLLGDKMPGGKEETADAGELVDKAAELQAKWQVQRGDVWQVGKHRVMCGDSTNAADVARLMGGERAAMVFTDPPYGNQLGYGRGQLGERYIENDDSTAVLTALPEILDSILDNNSHCLIWIQWRTFAELTTLFSRYKLRTVVVWDKQQAGLSGGGFAEQHEWLAVFIKGKATQNDYSGNLWRASRENHFGGRVIHPTMKPVELWEKGLRLCSKPDDIAVDLFIGSGGFLVACEQTGRIGRGMEIEPKYVAVTLERLTALGLEAKRVTDTNGNGKTKATA